MSVSQYPYTRRCVRVPFFARFTLAELPNGPPIEARSVDISVMGVGLVCPKPFPVGKLVSLTFHPTAQTGAPTAEQVSGRVANVRFNSDAIVVGIEFTPALDRRFAPALVRAIERL